MNVPDPQANELPTQVRKRDGRLEPFNADQISAALYLAGEALGEANTFLAHELTQSVLFFLAQENLGPVAASVQIVDLVTKVVRELGQPRLAQAFEEHALAATTPAAEAAPLERALTVAFPPQVTPDEVARACLAEYSLTAMFSRDLAAAHRDGYLCIHDLHCPARLRSRTVNVGHVAGGVDELIGRCWQAVCGSARQAGAFVAVDGLDPQLARLKTHAEISNLLRQIHEAGRAAGLGMVLNANSLLPASADGGPLFAASENMASARSADLLNLLDDTLISDHFRVYWHLNHMDIQVASGHCLSAAAARAFVNSNFTLVFDRPRKPVILGEGLERGQPAVLLDVDVHLPRVADGLGSSDVDALLGKLSTLMQMAVSAAAQKRRFLRDHNEALCREFLLERARLRVTPIGLQAVAARNCGETSLTAPRTLDLARQITAALGQHLRQAGAAAGIDVCLGAEEIDVIGDLKTQVRALATLHAGGVLTLRVQGAPPEDLGALIRYVWQRTELMGLRFNIA